MFDYTYLAGLGIAEDKLREMRNGISKIIQDLERDSNLISPEHDLKQYLLDTANELRSLL